MAFTINGTLIVDETAGKQNGAPGVDTTGNDIADGLGFISTTVSVFDTILLQMLKQNLSGVNVTVAVSGGTNNDADGAPMITGLGPDVSDLAFTSSTGGALNGVEALSAPGTPLLTVDGSKIFLYSYSSLIGVRTVGGGSGFLQDIANVDENNAVFGIKGVLSGGVYVPDPNGNIVFAAYLQPTDASGVVQAGDANAVGAKVWLVQYEEIQHPDTANPDDALSLANLHVSVSTFTQFSLTGAPSGQNLFMMFGDGTPSVNDATIVVTGRNPINQSEPGSPAITDGDTVNTGKGGGATTLGTNSQSIVEGSALYFTFVKGADTNLTVPNLDQNEADVEANIAFTSLFGSSGASFTLVQSASGDQSTLEISAYNPPDTTAVNAGVDFIDNLHNNTAVEITKVTVVTQPTKVQGKDVPGETLVFSKTGPGGIGTTPTTLSGVTVTFSADTVTIQGLDASDFIKYETSGLHTRVLIDNIGSTDTNFDAPFDIGGFSLTTSTLTPNLFPALTFQDDGPTADVTDAGGSVTIDETMGVDASNDDVLGTALLGGQALTTVFAGVATKGSDGAELPQYALSDAPLVSTAGSVFGSDGAAAANSTVLSLVVTNGNGTTSNLFTTAGNEIFLFKEGNLIVGRYETTGGGGITTADAAAFAIALGEDGNVATVQYVSLTHNSPGNGTTPPGSYDEQVDLTGKVDVKWVVTDGDGDTSEDTVAIGNDINFEDDGPSVSANGTVLLDDDALGGNAGGTGDDVNSANASGTVGHNFGQDQENATVAYLTTGAPSGFTYELSGTSLLVKQGTTTVLTLTMVAGTGAYTVTQNNPIAHTAGLDENNQTFTINYRVTDGDGDTADGTLGINVDDDTPVVMAKSNLVYANSSNPPPAGDPGGTGVFAYAIGADTRAGTTYSATNSDFVGPITLTGTVGASAIPITGTSVTWFSESATQAVFNVDFTYVSNPITSATTTVDDAKLIFDKTAGTYTLQVPEIATFTILQTNTAGNPLQGYSLNSATTQGSNPPVSVMTLANNFFVQFEGFGVNNGTPQTFAYDQVTGLFSNDRRYVTVSSDSIGAASDTLQSNEVIDLDFYTANPLGFVNSAVTRATSATIFIEFEQVGPGAGKDMVVVLKLVDPDDGTTINRTFIVGNSAGNDDIINTTLPAYDFVAAKQNGIVVFESNDYNFGNENYVIQGAQVVTSTQGQPGSGYNFNGAIDDPSTLAVEGATPNTTSAFGGDTTEGNNEPIKIINIGFVDTATQDAHLSFSVAVKDTDGDATAPQTLDVSIVGGNGTTATPAADTIVIDDAASADLLNMVMHVVSGGFASGTDKLDMVEPGSTGFVDGGTATDLKAFIAAADTALNGTTDFYAADVGTDTFVAFDADGTGITTIVQLVGVTTLTAGDII